LPSIFRHHHPISFCLRPPGIHRVLPTSASHQPILPLLKHFNLLIAPPPERHQAPAIINHRLPSVQTQSPTFIQSPLSLNHQLPGIIIISAFATNFNTVYHYPDRCPSVALLSVSRQLSPFDHGPPRLNADAICSLDDSLNQSVASRICVSAHQHHGLLSRTQRSVLFKPSR